MIWGWGLTESSSDNASLCWAKDARNVKTRVPFSKPVCDLCEFLVTLALPESTSCNLEWFQGSINNDNAARI